MIHKIISGGQTGADIGALRAAQALGLATGGYAAHGWRTENGPMPALGTVFGLIEHSSSRYPARTQSNILASDGTLLFGNASSPGSALTLHYCKQYDKPVFLRLWPQAHAAQTPYALTFSFLQWLKDHDIKTLNVAGNRESVNSGIALATEYFLHFALGDCATASVSLTNKETTL